MKKQNCRRQDIIKAICHRTSLSPLTCQEIFEDMICLMKEKFKQGIKVKLGGFGTFYVCNTKAKKSRNPKTGQDIPIPVRKTVRF